MKQVGRIFEALECRLLLDGTFSWTQLDGRIPLGEFSGTDRNFAYSSLDGSGNAYYPTKHEDDLYHIRKIPRDTLTSNSRWPSAFEIVHHDLYDLEAFDVNRNGLVGAIHEDPWLGTVISKPAASGDKRILAIDALPPRAHLKTPNASNRRSGVYVEVEYRDYTSIDHSTIDESDIAVFELNGDGSPERELRVELSATRWRQNSVGQEVEVEYLVHAPQGGWKVDRDNEIEYEIRLKDNAVADLAGNTSDAITLGRFSTHVRRPPSDIEELKPRKDFEDPASLESYATVSSELVTYLNGDDLPPFRHWDFEAIKVLENGEIAFGLTSSGEAEAFAGRFSNAHATVFSLKGILSHESHLNDPGNGLFESSTSGHGFDATLDTTVVATNHAIYLSKGGGSVIKLVSEDDGLTPIDDNLSITPDSSVIVFDAYISSAELALSLGAPPGAVTHRYQGWLDWEYVLLGYDIARSKLFRIAGTTGDGFLDPGERWVKSREGLWDDVSDDDVTSQYTPQLIDGSFAGTVGSGRDFWVASNGITTHDNEIFEQVFVRRVSLAATGAAGVGPPILVSSQGGGVGREGLSVTFNPADQSFTTLQMDGLNSSTPPRVTYGTGRIPTLGDAFQVADPTAMTDSRHPLWERFAREAAYWELRTNSDFQIGRFYEEGYVVTGMHIDDDSPGGFVALELRPITPEGSPVLAFKGSEWKDNLTTNIEPNGIGFTQFKNNEFWVKEWASDMASIYKLPPTLVGHSLGGGLAQWFATAIVNDEDSAPYEVVTFNSPGIGAAQVNATDPLLKSQGTRVVHYIVSGDFVSLGGEKFLDGKVVLFHVDDPIPSVDLIESLQNGAYTLLRHGRPVLLDRLRKQDGSDYPQLNIWDRTVMESTEVLNHPEFSFMEDADFRYFVRDLYDIIGQDAHHAVSRQRAEAFRARVSSLQAVDFNPGFLGYLLTGFVVAPYLGYMNVILARLASPPATVARPVFLYSDLDSEDLPSAEQVGYEFEKKKLVLAAGTPLTAATVGVGGTITFEHQPTKSRTVLPVTGSGSLIGNRAPITRVTRRLRTGEYRVWADGLESTVTLLEITGSDHMMPRSDLNGDNRVNSADADLLYAAIAAGSRDLSFDFDQNSKVDAVDLRVLVEELMDIPTRQGDTNFDGRVEFADFLRLSINFGQDAEGLGDGDFNADGKVDFADFLILSTNFGFDRTSQ